MVEIYSWNPKRPVLSSKIGRRIPIKRRVNNFGDLLGPLVVDRMVRAAAIAPDAGDGRLLSVGSVLHQARDGDVVWGAGRNGKIPAEKHRFASLDVRAVRGPRTREFLAQRGIDCPTVYGDPALLLPDLVPELADVDRTEDVTVVPNFNDLRRDRGRWPRRVLDPCSPLWRCLRRIVSSRLVVGSSLHAIVVAEAFGVPARAVRSTLEAEVKYLDYYEGTGRSDVRMAETVDEALSLGGAEPPQWDAGRLRAAFPYDLWRR